MNSIAQNPGALLIRYGLLWAVLALCLYLPVLESGFFADDEVYLAFNNTALRDLTADNLVRLLVAPANPWEFLPVRDFSYWLDLQLFGDDGFGLHFTNLVLYALSALAFRWFVHEVLIVEYPHRAGATALQVATMFGVVLFLLHPAHVEPVAWISGRKDVLAGMFAFASLAALIRYVRTNAGSHFVLSAGLLLVAFFCKSATVVMVAPVLLLLLQKWSVAAADRRCANLVGVGVMFLLAITAVTVHMHFGTSLGIRVDNSPGLEATIERASRIFAVLVELLIFPADLGLFHDVYRHGSWHWIVTSTALLVMCWAILCLITRRSFAIPFVVFLVCIPLLPYLQLVPFSTWSMASERFLFIPVGGVALMFAVLWLRFQNHRAVLWLSFCVFGLFALATWNRVNDWRANDSLIKHEYGRQPDHYLSALHYMTFVLRRSDPERIPDALSKVHRDDARELLQALHDIWLFNSIRQKADRSEVFDVAHYCHLANRVYGLLATGQFVLHSEKDLAYSNLLRSVSRQMYYSLGDPQRRCGNVGQAKVDHELQAQQGM